MPDYTAGINITSLPYTAPKDGLISIIGRIGNSMVVLKLNDTPMIVVDSTATGNFVGGIVGYVSSSIIEKNDNIGAVQGTTEVGGVVGNFANGEVTSCTNSGIITGTDRVGGIKFLVPEK